MALVIDNLVVNVGDLESKVLSRLENWGKIRILNRLWEKDPSVWIQGAERADFIPDLTNRLGWLDIATKMKDEIGRLNDNAKEVVKRGIKDAVLLGMGGSSLAPEVLSSVFGSAAGYPELTVIDTTNPETILAFIPTIGPEKTLFLVSSKSGGTSETLSLYKYFYAYLKTLGLDAGRHFAAITDPGSGLERLAKEKNFDRIFSSPPDVGGRFSALTYFGLVPAALIGLNIDTLLKSAEDMMIKCAPPVSPEKNPAAVLGAAVGELALVGREKMTFIISPSIQHIGAWIEQLTAESLGKNGKGILPVIDEAPSVPEKYGGDRFFVYLRMVEDDNEFLDGFYETIIKNGIPSLKLEFGNKNDIGGIFFLLELATALAAAVIGVNPFDQPNVESAKAKTREMLEEYKKTRKMTGEKPTLVDGEIEFFGDSGEGQKTLHKALNSFLNQANKNDYISIMAYLPYDIEINNQLEEIRASIREKTGRAVTLGYGPRFLHSTGQFHKGGPNNGLFIQFTHDAKEDIKIPGEPYTFGVLIKSQAIGDYRALLDAGRRVIRININGDVKQNLKRIIKTR